MCEINGQIRIERKSTRALLETGAWLTDFIIGTDNQTTNLIRVFFGEAKELFCNIRQKDNDLVITIKKE